MCRLLVDKYNKLSDKFATNALNEKLEKQIKNRKCNKNADDD